MGQQMIRIELQIWRESGEEGGWRCRMITANDLQSARLDSPHALATYVASQLELLLTQHEPGELHLGL